MQLKNGDHLNNLCKLVFETGDITHSSPSLIAKAVYLVLSSKFYLIVKYTKNSFVIQGIVCYGDDLVGWRSIARSWLESRVQNEIQVILKA